MRALAIMEEHKMLFTIYFPSMIPGSTRSQWSLNSGAISSCSNRKRLWPFSDDDRR
ncbi:hypothetical protein RGR602_PC02015 (plasmid) [Rhizobium gallicum bv. gallicum R602sp]|uniref:Uncharacterized protein n=1 Tax=Rhizobium gallicum bv. gallicum R602sp TaxID=1041138 RepID=A0A0B4XHH3_9HYPH|nr:hypothetical protein RGR602_PC02015 [Rhizobium gallicum bv. gallicum R602sp]